MIVKYMFILLGIEQLQDDTQNLPANTNHKLTFKVIYTIDEVPDSFTGTVFENASGELKLEHFNNPKGNRRKIITLKNKLAPGSFEKIEQYLFAKCRGEILSFPQQLKTVASRGTRTMGG